MESSGFDDIPIVDCHSHTYLSGHGEGTVEELVSSAELKGISHLCITEHAPLPKTVDPTEEFSMGLDEVDGYFDAISQSAAKHPGMEVVGGFEMDWRPGCEDLLMSLSTHTKLLLGSVHMLADGWCFDDPAQKDGWNDRGVDDVWGEYFDLWMDACASDVPFTIMSHPDLPKKFGFMPTQSFGLQERYREAASLAAEKGRMVEVNTAGWRKEVAEQYPSVDFLHEFMLAGVDCSVGADAHAPAEVGYRIRDAYGIMRQAGYQRVTVPMADGSRRHIDLMSD